MCGIIGKRTSGRVGRRHITGNALPRLRSRRVARLCHRAGVHDLRDTGYARKLLVPPPCHDAAISATIKGPFSVLNTAELPCPLDAYSVCPGGTGKELKFCCPDFVGELQKIVRLARGRTAHHASRNSSIGSWSRASRTS